MGLFDEDNPSPLATARARYSKELGDPSVRDALFRLTHAEVGGQGVPAQQAFMESVINRAAARDRPLSQTIYDPNYFPPTTQQRMSNNVPEDRVRDYSGILDLVLDGSNVAKYATGNASGTVGFAGGPQTYAANGERFGIEGRDQPWAARIQRGEPMRDYAWNDALPIEQEQPALPPAARMALNGPPQQREPTFLESLAGRLQNPLTQQGLGLFLAASQGKDLNEGLSAGMKRAAEHQAYTKSQYEMALEQQRDQAVRKLFDDATSGKFGQLPPGLLDIARTDPRTGANLIGNYLAANKDADLDRKIKIAQFEQATKKADAPVQIGEDAYGNKVFGLWDANSRTFRPVDPGNMAGASGAGQGAQPQQGGQRAWDGGIGDAMALGRAVANAQGLQGDDYLKSLPPAFARQVQAIAEYREPFPSTMARNSKEAKLLRDAVMNYRDDYTAANYPAAKKTQERFSVGPEASNVTAINTAAHHLHTLKDAVDELNNSDATGGNLMRQATKGISLQDPAYASKVRAAEMGINAVAEELAKAFHGGPSVSGVEHWRETLSPFHSKAEQYAALNTAINLLEGRTQALQEQYDNTLGPGRKKLISPTAQKAYDELKGLLSGKKSGGKLIFNPTTGKLEPAS